MNRGKYPFIVRLYLVFNKIWQKSQTFLNSCFTGFWLGMLKREDLHLIDKFLFSVKHKPYTNDFYNRSGLMDWEKEAINKYFQKCEHILVAAAGGGREVLGLSKLGYKVDGFECNSILVEYARRFLKKEENAANIQLAPRDDCPDVAKVYDGVIIGWGAYTLIQGRRQRVVFLRKLHAQMRNSSPLLFSFFAQPFPPRRFKIITGIANTIRWLLRRGYYTEIGDDILDVIYIHQFTKEEIISELSEAGFKLISYHAYNSTAHFVYVSAVGITSE